MKRVYGWAGVRYVITKFSQMDSLPNVLTHGAPLCARARSSAIKLPCLVLRLLPNARRMRPHSSPKPGVTVIHIHVVRLSV